jgi:hypothetical protein
VKRDESWRIILTCRDYSIDVVRSSFLAHAGLPHAVVSIPQLTDEELNQAVDAFPKLRRPATNVMLRKLFYNPYLLDKAARMQWPEDQPLPQDERSFRRKVWRELVRQDQHNVRALPQRREQAFIEIALRRARALSLFAPCDDLDQEPVAQLRNHNLIASPQATDTLAAPAHDVLEDWAILQWMEQRFARHERVAHLLAEDIGGFPAIRRAFRKWLGEMLECEAETADAFVWSVVRDASLAPHFRDDTIVCALLSSSAASFLERHRGLLLENERHLLRRVIHLLRVACKTTPHWLPFGERLPPLLFVPHGTAWAAVLRLVKEELHTMLPDDAGLVLGLIEDWATSVAWWIPYPEGSEQAGKIAFGLLPHLDSYGHNDMRKRALQVITKIPKADSDAFLELVDRSCARDRNDRAADDLAELLLKGTSGVFACRDFPIAIMRLAESRFCLGDQDLRTRRRFNDSIATEPIFGIRDHLGTSFFPPSAIRGPFLPLLRNHPQKGVDFIVRLMNHASSWYGERKWPGDRLEPAIPVQLQIPGEGEVTQWSNGRLGCLFRGIAAGPNVLQTALMALESWLVEICDTDDADVENLLLKLLRESNNVAVTAVVATTCNAHPEKAGKAGLAALTCREFFAMDLMRMAREASAPGGQADWIPMYGVKNNIYDDERRSSAAMPHRKHDLEKLAIKLQDGEHRHAVWQILDEYHAALPEVRAQTETDRLWRLALHRMDVRTYQPQLVDAEATEETTDRGATSSKTDEDRKRQWVSFLPSAIDDDLQEMVDRHAPVQARQRAEMALFNWGIAIWWRKGNYRIDANMWREKLAEARQHGADGTDITDFGRCGPGFVAAVCLRDHWDKMEQEDRDWCVDKLIIEIERDYDSHETSVRASGSGFNPSGPAAYVLPRVLSERAPDASNEPVIRAVAKSLTHAVSDVIANAAEGVGQYLHDTRRDFVLRCVGALARKARLIGELIASEEHLPYLERRRVVDLERSILPEIRSVVAGGGVDVEGEVTQLDLSHWPAQEGASAILAILSHGPHEVVARDVYGRLPHFLVELWERNRDHTRSVQRNYQIEPEYLMLLARFIMQLPVATALAMCQPLLDAVDGHPREVAHFVEDLVVVEDQSGMDSPFWGLWQAFADRLQTARWIHQFDSRYPPDRGLLDKLFLNLSWKDGIRNWRRLEGFADRVDTLFESLPPCATVLDAYCRFLYTIGEQSLPHSFVVVANRLQVGNASQMLSQDTTMFYLESLLRRFIYSQPLRIKTNAEARSAVLTILDQLVDSGSSAAYRMRDDFVTPIAHQDR